MAKPIDSTCGTLVLLAITAALLVSVPAAGADRLPGNTQDDAYTSHLPNVDDSTTPKPKTDSRVSLEEGQEPGPGANVGTPTFDTVWTPGVNVPSEVTVVVNDDSADLKVIKPTDRSFLMALITIEDKDAPTEYHFENVVPKDHTAIIHDDGSVRFYDALGDASGGIVMPWALDQQGTDVPTHYRLDGTTLIQHIDHSNAQYPVVADPFWIPVMLSPLAIRIAFATAAATKAYQTCARTQCVAVASKVIKKKSKPTESTPSNPSHNCFSWDKSGCS